MFAYDGRDCMLSIRDWHSGLRLVPYDSAIWDRSIVLRISSKLLLGCSKLGLLFNCRRSWDLRFRLDHFFRATLKAIKMIIRPAVPPLKNNSLPSVIVQYSGKVNVMTYIGRILYLKDQMSSIPSHHLASQCRAWLSFLKSNSLLLKQTVFMKIINESDLRRSDTCQLND